MEIVETSVGPAYSFGCRWSDRNVMMGEGTNPPLRLRLVEGAVQWRFAAAGVAVERWRRDHGRYWFNRPPEDAPADGPAPHEVP